MQDLQNAEAAAGSFTSGYFARNHGIKYGIVRACAP